MLHTSSSFGLCLNLASKTQHFWPRVLLGLQRLLQHSLREVNCVRHKSDPATSSEKSANSRMREYRKNQNLNLLNFPKLPPILLKRHIYVNDESLADEIVKAVRSNQTDPNVPILESNPGLGIMTRKLLESGVQQIVAAEPNLDMFPNLEEMQTSLGAEKLCVHQLDIVPSWFDYSTISGNQKKNEDIIEDIICKLVPPKVWTDDPPLTVIVILSNIQQGLFMKYFTFSCAKRLQFFQLGRVEWFCVVSSLLYKRLSTTAFIQFRLKCLPIVLNMLCNIQHCAELPGYKFTPAFLDKKNKLELQESIRHLIKIVPRIDVGPIAPDSTLVFYKFLEQLFCTSKQRLVFKLEQLIPGCGCRLIEMGVPACLSISETPTETFMEIFIEMQKWPEFETSPMKGLLEGMGRRDYFHVDEEDMTE